MCSNEGQIKPSGSKTFFFFNRVFYLWCYCSYFLFEFTKEWLFLCDFCMFRCHFLLMHQEKLVCCLLEELRRCSCFSFCVCLLFLCTSKWWTLYIGICFFDCCSCCFWYVSLFLVFFIDLFVDFCDGCCSKWWTWYAGWSRDWGESFVAPPSSANLISPQDQSLKKKKDVFQSFLFFLHAVEP